MNRAIFISYRRSDAADAAGRVYDKLAAIFGEEAVFKDVDALPVGADFGAYILRSLQQCRVVLVLIGPDWFATAGGGRRLDDPTDWVRLEIETALRAAHVQVIPVLLNGADMPSASALPETLRPLVALNAASVRRDPDFHRDMQRLIDALKEGALTGTVVVQNAPATPAEIEWAKLKDTTDVAELRMFAEHFTSTSEGLEARRRIRRLEEERAAFEAIDWNNEHDIDDFIEHCAQHHLHAEAIVRKARFLEAKAFAEQRAAQGAAARAAKIKALEGEVEAKKLQLKREGERFRESAEGARLAKKYDSYEKAASAARSFERGVILAFAWAVGIGAILAWFYIVLPFIDNWSNRNGLVAFAAGVAYLIAGGAIVGSINDYSDGSQISGSWAEARGTELDREIGRDPVFKKAEAEAQRLERQIASLEEELRDLRRGAG